MFLIDLILYQLALLIWPEPKEKPMTAEQMQQRRSGEDCGNWIILDHMDMYNRDEDTGFESDPFLNEEFGDGPEW